MRASACICVCVAQKELEGGDSNGKHDFYITPLGCLYVHKDKSVSRQVPYFCNIQSNIYAL